MNAGYAKPNANNGVFATFVEAYEEAQRLRATHSPEDMVIVRVEESPYSDGYVVRRMDAMLEFDMKLRGIHGVRRNKNAYKESLR